MRVYGSVVVVFRIGRVVILIRQGDFRQIPVESCRRMEAQRKDELLIYFATLL